MPRLLQKPHVCLLFRLQVNVVVVSLSPAIFLIVVEKMALHILVLEGFLNTIQLQI